jgi:hypothetical protein
MAAGKVHVLVQLFEQQINPAFHKHFIITIQAKARFFAWPQRQKKDKDKINLETDLLAEKEAPKADFCTSRCMRLPT